MSFKRLIAILAITLGVLFTAGLLVSIWGPEIWGDLDFLIDTPIGKITPTLGVLTVACVTLLGIIKMTEPKQ